MCPQMHSHAAPPPGQASSCRLVARKCALATPKPSLATRRQAALKVSIRVFLVFFFFNVLFMYINIDELIIYRNKNNQGN